MLTPEDFFEPRDTTLILGTVVTVNANRNTVDVHTELHELQLSDIAVMSPFYSPAFGQGLYQLPEPNTVCVVARHQSDWFVVGFLPPANDIDTQRGTADDQIAGSQNLFKDFAGQATALQEQAERSQQAGRPGRQSFRSNTERGLIAGDGIAKTSAGNKFKWLTNGTLIAEATKLCFRIWSRLQNKIIDLCVNHDLLTPGVQRKITNDEKTKEVDEEIAIRRKAGDKFPVVVLRRGNFADVYDVVVQDAESGNQTFNFHVDEDGKTTLKVGDPATPGVEIVYKPGGDVDTNAKGQYNIIITGDMKIQSLSKVTVDAPKVVIGEGGEDLLLKSSAAAKFNSHTHPSDGSPPTVQIDATDITVKTKAG